MITETDFITRLTPVFREELELDDLDISMETQQKDIENWDSLAHVRIVIGVERAFHVQLDVAEIEGITSVRGFYAAVNHHLK